MYRKADGDTMIRALVVYCLISMACGQAGAETTTVIIATPEESTQQINSTAYSVYAVTPMATDSPDLIRDITYTQLQYSRMDNYSNRLDELQTVYIQAGADYRLEMQWRYGADPEPFPTGYWPTATLRSARSPAGRVIADYTITIDDEAQVKWSLKLSATQTGALSGKKGYTELRIPYTDTGGYAVFSSIPTVILPRVTQ